MKYLLVAIYAAFLAWQSKLTVAGTVFGCYNIQGAAPDPTYLMGLSAHMVNRLLNCDGTVTPSSTGIGSDYAGFGGGLFNPSNGGGSTRPATDVLNSFGDLIRKGCPNSLGYWYYDGGGKREFITARLIDGATS